MSSPFPIVEDESKRLVAVSESEGKGPSPAAVANASGTFVRYVIALCAVVIIGELASIMSTLKQFNIGSVVAPPAAAPSPQSIIINLGDNDSSESMVHAESSESHSSEGGLATTKPPPGKNPCEGKKPDLPNIECVIGIMVNVGPQAGGNVTKGYQGELEVEHVPIKKPFWKNEMCPVNVHWHLGAEHYSLGQFDETGTSPPPQENLEHGTNSHGSDEVSTASEVRPGFMCKHYNEADPKFNTPYEWKHCMGMQVGQSYEVHWPHSAAGACGTADQYQTPFYDGVFCYDDVINNTANQIGVQSQVFTIVNDENYYYPDLMRGMIVDGNMGKDIAMYTGSTTGTSVDNEICSPFSPITWHVDRKCHLISASTFDKMCADMKAQRDDMSADLHPHGSRELVPYYLSANNQVSYVPPGHNRYLRSILES